MSTDTRSSDMNVPAYLSNASSIDAQTIVLHILSPSLEAPNRVTLDDIPLSIKISDLKTRLSETLPNRPRPDMQRLIYRGKPLSNNDEQLGNIVEPADGRVHTMHLVLPPSRAKIIVPRPPNLLQNTDPPSPQEESSGLRLRTNHIELTAQRPRGQAQINSAAIASQVASLRQQVAAQHQHLAAQIALNTQMGNPNRPGEAGFFATTSATSIPSHNNIESSPLYVDVNSPLYGTRFGMPASNLQSERLSSTPGNEGRNQLEAPSPSSRNTLINNASPRPPSSQRTASFPPSRSTWLGESGAVDVGSLGESRQRRIVTVLELIFGIENQLQRGNLPSIEEISRIRIELYQILDEQYRNPLHPRDGMPENLLARLSSITARADQIRTFRARSLALSPQNSLLNAPPSVQDVSQTSVYLLSSPAGYHAVLVPPTGAPGNGTSQPGARVFHTHRTPIHPHGTPIPQETLHAMPNATPVPPAVNQAIFHQQERHRLVFGPVNPARILRRLWLFARLYFFCYLFSENGTWFRIILISLSVLTALLSETDVLQRFQRLAIDPLHRHLENLLPMDIHQPRDVNEPPRDVNMNAPHIHPMQPNNINENLGSTNGTQNNAAMPNRNPASFSNRLRTAERALALLLASLVPGVGERRVAARNAAETARQQELAVAREGEENRAREQENDGAENQDNGSVGESEDATVPEPEARPADPTGGLEDNNAVET
ncbi:hypothetical protein AJ78_01473 [Emergomyces pasteurianus Ep9510]|uniref:Ubiquitin-like domain-containing protein n=1 Tax=Emergomyces pasteurianus Ep9510 TaxID=1447872 RepID=A0A1J9QRH5_9EURO|nr:hypothetical protein AJ78_01473 [Emergomyces pasteurianus Ep9510]